MNKLLLVSPLLLLPLALTAHAAPPGSQSVREVAVVDLSSDTRAHAELVHEIVEAIDDSVGYAVKDIDSVLNAGGEVEARNNIKTAQAFYRAGGAALEAGDPDEASLQFESAARLMETAYALLPEPEQYDKALLQLGAARLANGDAAGAAQAFERAALHRADASGVKLSAEAKAAWEAAQAKVNARPLGAVEVITEPEYAEVYVDGRYRGISPTTVAGLREGQHLVTVEKLGYERLTAQVTISSRGLVRSELNLPAARKKLVLDQLEADLARELDALGSGNTKGGDAVRQVGSLLFSEVGVIVRVTGPEEAKEVDMVMFDTASQRLLNRVTVPIDWSFRNREAVRQAVAQLLEFDYAAALGAVAGPGPSAGGGGSVLGKWWFWTAVVGVVGAGTVAAIALSDDERPPPFANNGTGAVVLNF